MPIATSISWPVWPNIIRKEIRNCRFNICDSLKTLIIPHCAAACQLPTAPSHAYCYTWITNHSPNAFISCPLNLFGSETEGFIFVIIWKYWPTPHCAAACQLPTAPCHAYCYTWITNHSPNAFGTETNKIMGKAHWEHQSIYLRTFRF